MTSPGGPMVVVRTPVWKCIEGEFVRGSLNDSIFSSVDQPVRIMIGDSVWNRVNGAVKRSVWLSVADLVSLFRSYNE